MNYFKIFYILILFLLSCSKIIVNNPKAINGIIDLSEVNFQKNSTVNLDGEWEFYPNEFIYPNQIISSKPGLIVVPTAWNLQSGSYSIYPKYGYGTYKVKIKLNNNIDFPTLKFQYIGSSYRLFCNGKEYQSSGKPGISSDESVPSITVEEFSVIKNDLNELDLILHVSNFQISNGGLNRSIQIGSVKAITDLHTREDAIHWLFTGMIFIMGLYHLGIYFLRVKDLTPLYFGLYCILSSIREFYIVERGINRIFPEINFSIWVKLDQLFLFLSIAFFAYYMKSLFPKDTSRSIIRVTASFQIFLCIYLIFSPLDKLFITEDTAKVTIPLLSLYYLFVLIQVLINKRESGLLFLLGFSVVYICIINDLLYSMNIISTDRLLPYGITFLIFIQSYILSSRFNKAFNDAELFRIQLEKMSKVKDEFMSNLSHEIRTPLSLIYAYSELLKDYSDNDIETIKSYGLDIYREANVLSENINDLLLVTNLETQFIIKNETVNISSIIKEAISYLDNLIDENSIKIDLKNLKDYNINCDKSLLYKVFIIIIKNSILYNNQPANIKIYTEEINSTILIYIDDNGVGISSDDLLKVFDKFYRVDSSITYRVSGVGVGLFIAKRIIDLHKAKIDISSTLGKGTSVRIQFPKLNHLP